jgi:hypothetical protein
LGTGDFPKIFAASGASPFGKARWNTTLPLTFLANLFAAVT